jgi:hypothetical protein
VKIQIFYSRITHSTFFFRFVKRYSPTRFSFQLNNALNGRNIKTENKNVRTRKENKKKSKKTIDLYKFHERN